MKINNEDEYLETFGNFVTSTLVVVNWNYWVNRTIVIKLKVIIKVLENEWIFLHGTLSHI